MRKNDRFNKFRMSYNNQFSILYAIFQIVASSEFALPKIHYAFISLFLFGFASNSIDSLSLANQSHAFSNRFEQQKRKKVEKTYHTIEPINNLNCVNLVCINTHRTYLKQAEIATSYDKN